MEHDEKKEASEAEAALEKAIIESADVPQPVKGDRVEGTIISISDSAVLVDCGMKAEAVLDPRELDGQAVGDRIEGIVTEVEPSFSISTKLTAGDAAKAHLQAAFDNQIPVTGKIASIRKGGFDVEIAGERAFLPVSQLDSAYVEDTSPYIGKSFEFQITEFDAGGKKFVVSRAALLKKAQEKELETIWEKLEPGEVFDGTVKSIQSFGAFVDLGGVEGLVHISEISQSYITHPSEALKIGDAVKVKVLKADRDQNRVALSIKELAPDPWESFSSSYNAGAAFTGAVVRHADFGIFVELEPGIDGLLHVSQLKPETELTDSAYSVGQKIEGWIRSIDLENKRVSLTLRNQAGAKLWDNLPSHLQQNAVVSGKVEDITKFGVFVELEPGLTGLMPFSELRKLGFKDLATDFPAGSEVEVRITNLDASRKRISLMPDGVAAPEPQKTRSAGKISRPRPSRGSSESSGSRGDSVSEFGMRLAAALNAKKKPNSKKK